MRVMRACRAIRKVWAVLALAAAVNAANYYLDSVDGDDNAEGGSPGTAWKTLRNIDGKTLSPGDSVLFARGGAWSGKLTLKGSGTGERPVYVGAYGDGPGNPVLDAGGAEATLYLPDVDYFTVEGLTITNKGTTKDRYASGISLFSSNDRVSEGIVIRNNEVRDITTSGALPWRASCSAIYYNTSGTQSRFRNMLIEDNDIHHVKGRAITGFQGVKNWENPTYMNDSLVIRRNRIYWTGADAIRPVAWKNVIVERNAVVGCGQMSANDGDIGCIAACFPQQCINSVWQHNEISYTWSTRTKEADEDSEAFDVDWGVAGTHTFQYNYTHHNGAGFMLFMGSIMLNQKDKLGPLTAVIVRYNVSVEDGLRDYTRNRTFEVHGFNGNTMNTLIYNNTFYNSDEIYMHWRSGDDYRGITFLNNLFVSPSGTYSAFETVSYDNNWYAGHFPAERDGNAKTGDPLLVNPGSADSGMAGADAYRLQENSGARGAGAIVQNNGGRDFWGNPLPAGGPPDIGAHQFTKGEPTPAGTVPHRDHGYSPRIAIRLSGRNGLAVSVTALAGGETLPISLTLVDLTGPVIGRPRRVNVAPGVNMIRIGDQGEPAPYVALVGVAGSPRLSSLVVRQSSNRSPR